MIRVKTAVVVVVVVILTHFYVKWPLKLQSADYGYAQTDQPDPFLYGGNFFVS